MKRRAWYLGAAGVAILAGMLATSLAANGAPAKLAGMKADNFMLEDQHGVGQELYYFRSAPAVVIVTQKLNDKPSAQALAAIEKVRAGYAAKGVMFFGLDSNIKDDWKAIDKATDATPISILDDDLQLVGRSLGVTQTGETFVIDTKTWTIAYHGPADGIGKTLDAIVAGKPAGPVEASIKGTVVDFPDRKKVPDFKNISYVKDVAPVLGAKCTACHATNGIAPFAMNSYEVIKGFAPTIREALRTKRMPPYHADSHGAEFKNDLRLSDDQLKTVVNWIEAGALRGEGEDPLKTLNPTAPQWPYGQPDVVLDLPEFQVPATGIIPYQYFTVPNPTKEDKYLSSVVYLPGASKALHHIVAGWNPDGVTSRGQNWAVDTGGWGPGSDPTRYPTDTGNKVPANGAYTFEMHYTPNGKAQTDHTKVGIYYSKQPPKNILRQLGIADFSIEIPAGDGRRHERGYVEFPADVLLYAVRPHAHVRGYATKLTIRYPDGHEELLHNQPRYDFNWQREYVFKDWLPVPAHSILIADYIFDNSVDNKSNPDPKSDVAFGEQTFNEMLFTYLHYLIVGEDREHPRDDVQAAITKSIAFSVLDDNIDRKIEPEELRGSRFAKLKAEFAKFDKNGDGGLDKDEYFAAMVPRARNADAAAAAAKPATATSGGN